MEELVVAKQVDQAVENLLKTIREIQAHYGLSEKEMAKRIGCDPSYLWRLKNHKDEPGIRFIRALTKAFKDPRVAVAAWNYVTGGEA